jgi:serine/threonine-protein kinase
MWHGQTDILIMQALSTGRIPDAREVNPKIDPELEQIVARALAPKPENRYQTAKELRKDIETYLASRTERLNPRRIGEWVAELFEKERKNLTRVIQQQLSSGGGDGSIAQLAPRVASSGESSPSASAARGFALSSPPPSMPPERAASVSIPSAAVRALKPNRWLAIGLGAGGAIALFTLILVIVILANPSEGEVTAVPATPTVPRVAATPVPADKPERIEVRLSAQPSDAKLFLDGRALDQNPFVGSFPADQKDHELRIEAEGHETVTRRISFERDVMIELSLEKSASKKTAGPVGARPPPPKPGEAFPDLESPKPKSTAKPIDTNDPWK